MDLYVARQPIFDANGEVAAYELLYRRSLQSHGADGDSREQMSLEVIVRTFLEMGLRRVTGDRVGFVNFSREMLLAGHYELMDRRAVVVELLEDVEPDEEVMAACERLVALGYRLALDDYEAEAGHEPLLPFAEIVKLDVLDRTPEAIQEVAEPLRARGLCLLAERVETAEVYELCRELGFELFQGYFFSRPEVVSQRSLSVEHATILQLMNLLRDDSIPDPEVEEAFRRDPALSYKLLRMVNAAAQGGRGIESILHAIRIVGRDLLQQWLGLLLASSLATRTGADSERVQSAVLRARMCERIGSAGGRRVTGPLFMTGLFSRMDVLLQLPMAEILAEVQLAPAVADALLRREGPHAPVLAIVEAYEQGDWDGAARLAAEVGVEAAALPALYLDSLHWAQERLALS